MSKNLKDREFTGEDYEFEDGRVSKTSKKSKSDTETKEEPKVRVPYDITYLVNYVEPEEGFFQWEFFPTPSTKDILDELIKKKPHLERLRHRITIIRANPIRKDENKLMGHGSI